MKQLFTALITPFDESLNIDFSALETLIDQQINAGVHGLVILGTTAEAELLSHDEQLLLVDFVCQKANGRIKITVGCGKSSTLETLRLAIEFMKFPVKNVMVVMPPYVKPDRRGLYEHFKLISNESIPFIAYHHPGRTGLNPSIETLESILSLPSCQGLKDASGGCDVMKALACDYTIYSGDDSMLIPHLSLGASGIISVCSHIIPEAFLHILEHFTIDPVHALKYFKNYLGLIDAIFKEPNPVGIKAALSLKGTIQNFVRPPYMSAASDNLQNLSQILDTYVQPNDVQVDLTI